MKILVISPTPTHPVTAGNRARILALVQALQGLGHEVHVALATLGVADLDAMRTLLGSNLHVLRCQLPYAVGGVLPRLRRKWLRAIGSEQAYLWALDEYYDTQLSPQIAALCAQIAFDAVFVEYVFMSKALDAIAPGVLKILDTHDRFALRHRSFLQAGQTPQWFSTSVAEETAGLRRADFVVAIQEQEAEIFSRQLGAGHTQVVTVGHLLSVQQRIVPATTSSAVFLASDNPINVDGAQYFIDNVLPLVRREKADFRFILAGDVGNKAGAGNGAVVRLGRVDSVADAFRNAALSVNPVRMGTGLNIKMLEALACGVACVSSQTGSRGLERYHQQAFATVPDNDPGVMAQAVLRLLNDRPAAVRLADAGLRLVQEWNAVQLSGLVRVLAAATANVQSPLSRCNVA
jgi:glycosyltransferase involved in cell wall biosynthesis